MEIIANNKEFTKNLSNRKTHYPNMRKKEKELLFLCLEISVFADKYSLAEAGFCSTVFPFLITYDKP
jgi:hypothetical protein